MSATLEQLTANVATGERILATHVKGHANPETIRTVTNILAGHNAKLAEARRITALCAALGDVSWTLDQIMSLGYERHALISTLVKGEASGAILHVGSTYRVAFSA